MAKDVDHLQILLDNQDGTYYAGHSISGCFKFQVLRPCNTEGVLVRFHGETNVSWQEEKTTGNGENRQTETVTTTETETYFDHKDPLYYPPNGVLTPYNFTLPFSFQLPSHIPSSFSGTHGRICYWVRGIIQRKGRKNNTVELPFFVAGVKNLNLSPELCVAHVLRDHKRFGILWWKSQPLSAELCINKQSFVSGEKILVSGFIDNKSNVTITQCELLLMRHVTYTAQGQTRSEENKVCLVKAAGVEKASRVDWFNTVLPVPALPPSDLDGSKLISTSYSFQIRVVPAGARFPLVLKFSVVIGTVPFSWGRPHQLEEASTVQDVPIASSPFPVLPPQPVMYPPQPGYLPQYPGYVPSGYAGGYAQAPGYVAGYPPGPGMPGYQPPIQPAFGVPAPYQTPPSAPPATNPNFPTSNDVLQPGYGYDGSNEPSTAGPPDMDRPKYPIFRLP